MKQALVYLAVAVSSFAQSGAKLIDAPRIWNDRDLSGWATPGSRRDGGRQHSGHLRGNRVQHACGSRRNDREQPGCAPLPALAVLRSSWNMGRISPIIAVLNWP
jgi:hypothetical protein